ncbi:MAG: hypothetical protein H6712_11200 [Myxococcales bacterium]|nr:hypothetical protein [Myxococcales bacterium]MCB9714418.1 hypothetical protein [Myxococcales bacterium]
MALALLALGCARGLGDPHRFGEGECRATYTLDHEDSPSTELRELGGGGSDLQPRFPAAEIDPAEQRPVSATAGLGIEGRPIAWYSKALDVVVLDGAAFAPLRAVDATVVAPGAVESIGRVTAHAREALGDRGVLELLLRAGVVRSYWQLGADLCVSDEQIGEGEYRARLHGVHHLRRERGRRGEQPLAFELWIDAEGEITLAGREASP